MRVRFTELGNCLLLESDVTDHRIIWCIDFQDMIANSCQFLFVIGLCLLGAGNAEGQTSAASRGVPLPTESGLSRNPGLATEWANRVMANDPKVRAVAEGALVQG